MIDVDGTCSSRLVYNYLKTENPNVEIKIFFQTWDLFGITGNISDTILAEQPESVYILDVGSGTDTLLAIRPILEKGIPVTLFDNHPPDIAVIGAEKYNEYTSLVNAYKMAFPLIYKSTIENCTTGVVYAEYESVLEKMETNKLWAILGLKGDVAYDDHHPEGKRIYDKCMQTYKQLNRSFHYGSFGWNNIDFMTNVLNNPRRIIYDDAPPICFAALGEMETNPKFFGTGWLNLYKLADDIIVGKPTALPKLEEWRKQYPNVVKLIELYVKWKEWSSVYKERGGTITLDYGSYGVSLIEHPWNIASALCNVKANDMKKAHFTINNIPNKHIHVSGRSYKDDMHIGKVFANCNPEIMTGGGLLQAGAANAKVNNVETILEELTNTASRLYPGTVKTRR